MKGTIYVKAEKCLGCRTCELECARRRAKTDSLADALALENVAPGVRVEKHGAAVVPLQCGHCSTAPCIAACPKNAIARDEKTGAVVLSREMCVGCRACIYACPHGIPEEGGDRKVSKCDLCHEDLVNDLLPACVRGCPVKALCFTVTEEER